jgi:undecaprenyl diphosphate synthase
MSKIPIHLGIILDGNRRWAEERGFSVPGGHRAGAEKIKEIVRHAKERGIKILTLFVFSTENWKRPKKEINFLMKLLEKSLGSKDIKKIGQEGIKIKVIGQFKKLPKSLQKRIKETEELTEKNREMVLNFALSYGGRAEITEAIKNIIKNKIPPEKITEKVISQNLWTSDLDLLIRTGKEQRISNFLIWQSAYSELYFSKKYWPDFSKKDLDEAISDYARRQRRLGA